MCVAIVVIMAVVVYDFPCPTAIYCTISPPNLPFLSPFHKIAKQRLSVRLKYATIVSVLFFFVLCYPIGMPLTGNGGRGCSTWYVEGRRERERESEKEIVNTMVQACL